MTEKNLRARISPKMEEVYFKLFAPCFLLKVHLWKENVNGPWMDLRPHFLKMSPFSTLIFIWLPKKIGYLMLQRLERLLSKLTFCGVSRKSNNSVHLYSCTHNQLDKSFGSPQNRLMQICTVQMHASLSHHQDVRVSLCDFCSFICFCKDHLEALLIFLYTLPLQTLRLI